MSIVISVIISAILGFVVFLGCDGHHLNWALSVMMYFITFFYLRGAVSRNIICQNQQKIIEYIHNNR